VTPLTVSFANDIRPLFRRKDIDHMRPFGVMLEDFAYMSDPTDNHRHGRDVGDFLSGTQQPRMPIGGPFWTPEQLGLYEQWMTGGFRP
jgi:hypothetical protein